ncbi:MAG: hypothetical protein WB952_15030 [Terriglobales bacterium]
MVGVVFLLALATACSRHSGVLPLSQPIAASHDLPFNRGSEDSGFSPTQAFDFSAVPAGTPIIVRLTSPLSSAGSRTGDAFEAVLDEPILVHGQLRVQRGAPVTGRVAAAKPFDPPNHAGYLRLTLSSMIIGKDIQQLHTSSVFAKGSRRGLDEVSAKVGLPAFRDSLLLGANEVERAAPRTGDAKFSTAQRLTFRQLGTLPTGR